MTTKRKELEKQREELLHEIEGLSPWLEGSVVVSARRCGKKKCACHHEGPKHPVMYITWKEEGKTVSLYVQRGLEAEASVWAANYKRLKKLIRDISNIQKEILRLREE